MRKATFHINDFIGLQQIFPEEVEEWDNIKKTFDEIPPFICTYIIYYEYPENWWWYKRIDKYELLNKDGNKININILNGYQKMILNDCIKFLLGSSEELPIQCVLYTDDKIGNEEIL